MKHLMIPVLFLFMVCTLIESSPRAQSNAEAMRVLKRFKHEPNIREMQKKALSYALVNQNRIRGLFARASVSGWLPRFRARYQYNSEDDRSTSFPTPTSAILTDQDTDLDHRLEFRLEWNLSDLIFNRNELSVYKELKKLVELRTDILKEITKLYFERRRLQVDLILAPPRSLLNRIRRILRLQELTADLDGLTGGHFSRRLKSAGHDPYK
ncbi:MAG TPA: hypothetical protein DCE42_00560 [Myxococcales bacterium]|nr:hypothetical protein [Deltaproteobacteria bacterium]MBU51323.1 hypothetical protein [Deltaproteobacteria bacterium]HAA53210.1 hypothetical protein [Myxococcales bacterium]